MPRKTSRRYILRFNQANPASVYSFESLEEGVKKVETRSATKKYRNIKKGDELVFVCGSRRFSRRVRGSRFFKSISEMLGVYSVKDIMPDLHARKELERAYYSYPNYKGKIKRYGLIALTLAKFRE